MKRGSVLLSTAFSACICIFWWRRWYLPSLYHGGYSHVDLLPCLVGGFSVVFFLSLAIIKLNKTGKFFVRTLLVALPAYYGLKAVANIWWINNSLPVLYNSFAIIFCISLAIFITIKGRVKFWEKMPISMLLATVFFVITPLLLSAKNAPAKNSVFGIGLLEKIHPSPKNVVFLILDETSPEVAVTYASTIESMGIPYQLREVTAAGENTVNAIPAMLLGMRFDNVSPCGSSKLCSGTNSVDFSDFMVVRRNVDVVGFWHPYCAIPGLRSCQRVKGLFSPGLFVSFVCATPGMHYFVDCFLKKGMRDGFLAGMIEMLFSAPFWREGGMLFIHLPIPHPSMEGYEKSLSNDYHKNVVIAGEILKSILDKIQERFPDDFLLIVTSDHALRINMWCSDDNLYPSKGCSATVPPNRGMVPLIVAGPRMTSDIKLPDSNVGVLAGE